MTYLKQNRHGHFERVKEKDSKKRLFYKLLFYVVMFNLAILYFLLIGNDIINVE